MIRIWDSDSGTQLQELRRGSDHADVYCIAFDPVSRYLSCSSDKGTIHIFAIRQELSMAAQSQKMIDASSDPQPEGGELGQSESSNTRSMFSFMKGVLPKYFDSEWSFAQLRIVDSHCICSIKDNKVIAVSLDGNYYLADIDHKLGGECKKSQQRSLLPTDE